MFSKNIVAAAFGAALMLPASAFADATAEMSTAAIHAGLAANATDIAGVRMHLHHALNCLVGPKGVNFDSGNMNPCAKMGSGAIPDTADVATRIEIENVLPYALSGLNTDDIDVAKKDASDLADQIKAVK